MLESRKINIKIKLKVLLIKSAHHNQVVKKLLKVDLLNGTHLIMK